MGMMSVDYNGAFYTVTLPNGQTWTYDESDRDLNDIDDAIEAWTIWRDYVQADMLKGQL